MNSEQRSKHPGQAVRAANATIRMGLRHAQGITSRTEVVELKKGK